MFLSSLGPSSSEWRPPYGQVKAGRPGCGGAPGCYDAFGFFGLSGVLAAAAGAIEVAAAIENMKVTTYLAKQVHSAVLSMAVLA